MNKQLCTLFFLATSFSLFSMHHPYQAMCYHDPNALRVLAAAAGWFEDNKPFAPTESEPKTSRKKISSKIKKSARQFACTKCTQKYKSAIGLKVHLADHNGKQSFKCEPCSYATNNPSNFKGHLKSLRHQSQLHLLQSGVTFVIQNPVLVNNAHLPPHQY